jgi:hypothetical protein
MGGRAQEEKPCQPDVRRSTSAGSEDETDSNRPAGKRDACPVPQCCGIFAPIHAAHQARSLLLGVRSERLSATASACSSDRRREVKERHEEARPKHENKDGKGQGPPSSSRNPGRRLVGPPRRFSDAGVVHVAHTISATDLSSTGLCALCHLCQPSPALDAQSKRSGSGLLL